MATYNGEKYIKEQLSSILDQISENDEIVISDDSSHDNTISIILSFQDKRIVLLKDQMFRSPIYNFENALRHSNGEYIILADQDDLWLPGRVERILPLFNDYDLILNDCTIVDEKLLPIHNSFFNIVKAKPGLFRNLTRSSPYIGCCMAFKREILKMAIPFPKNIPMHDFWIGIIAEVHYKVKFLTEPLLLYRRHASNASITSVKSTNSFFKKISFRVQILKSLIIRNYELFMINKRRNTLISKISSQTTK